MRIKTVFPLAVNYDRIRRRELAQPIFEVQVTPDELSYLLGEAIVSERDRFNYERCVAMNRVPDMRVFCTGDGLQLWLHDTMNEGVDPGWLGHSLDFKPVEADYLDELLEKVNDQLALTRESLFEVGIPIRFNFQRFQNSFTLESVHDRMTKAMESITNSPNDELAWAVILGKASFDGTWRDLLNEAFEELELRIQKGEKGPDDFFDLNLLTIFELQQRADRAGRNLRELLDKFPPFVVQQSETVHVFLSRLTDDELVELTMLYWFCVDFHGELTKLVLMEVQHRLEKSFMRPDGY